MIGRDLLIPGGKEELEAAEDASAAGRGGDDEDFDAGAAAAAVVAATAATASAAVQSRIIPAGEPAGKGLAPVPSAASSSLHLNDTAEASSAPKEIVAAEEEEGEEGRFSPWPFCRHHSAGGVASTSKALEAAEASPWARTLKTCLPSSRALNETGEEQGFQAEAGEEEEPASRAHSNAPAPPPAAVPNSNSTSRPATTPSGPFRTVATTTSQRPAPLADDEAAAAAAAWALTKGLCAEAKTPVNSPSAASA